MAPETDQQERAQARQLPERRQQQQVFGQDDAEHRPHEEQQQAEKALLRVVGAQVVTRVHDDQQPDDQDQQREQQAEAVEAERRVQAQCRHPGPALHQRAAFEDHPGLRQHDGERDRHHGGGRARRIDPERTAQHRRQPGARKRDQDGEWEQHASVRERSRFQAGPEA